MCWRNRKHSCKETQRFEVGGMICRTCRWSLVTFSVHFGETSFSVFVQCHEIRELPHIIGASNLRDVLWIRLSGRWLMLGFVGGEASRSWVAARRVFVAGSFPCALLVVVCGCVCVCVCCISCIVLFFPSLSRNCWFFARGFCQGASWHAIFFKKKSACFHRTNSDCRVERVTNLGDVCLLFSSCSVQVSGRSFGLTVVVCACFWLD